MDALTLVASCLLAGLCAGRFGLDAPGFLASLAAMLALACGALLIATRAEIRGAHVLFTMACALGCGLAIGAARAAPSIVPRGPARFEAIVEENRHGERLGSLVRIDHGELLEDRRALPRGARIWLDGIALHRGTHVRAIATLRPRVPFRNPTPHPSWPLVIDIEATANVTAAHPVEILRTSIPHELVEAIRDALRAALVRTLDEPALGVCRALVLGEAEALSPREAAPIRAAGLAHVLAVSGVHVALFAGSLVWALERWMRRWARLARRFEARRVAALLGIPLTLLYAQIAGGSDSAERAAVTASLAFAITAAGRRPKSLHVASGAALLLAMFAPDSACSPGFLLSVLATSVLVGSRDRVEGARAILASGLRASVRTTLVTAPLVAWIFGGVPWIGVLANVLLVPLTVALLPIASVHALVALVADSSPTTVMVDVAARAFVAGAQLFADAPGATFPPLSVPEGVFVCIAAWTPLLPLRPRRIVLVVLLAVVGIATSEVILRDTERPQGVLRVTFLDVGQGDSALIDLPDGSLMLVDAGGGLPDPGRVEIVPLLAARRRATIDIAVLSHPHPDHYGGLRALVDAMPVRELWDTGQSRVEAPTGDAARLVDHVASRGAITRGPLDLCGRPRRYGAATIEVLAPCPSFDSGYGENDNSFALRISIGHRSFLLAGDAEAAEEARLARRDVRADVLKVTHHGSRTSSSAAFLDAVRPSVAVISAGLENRYGHPHAETLDALGARNIAVHRIDRQGGVVITSDGETLAIERLPQATAFLPKPRSSATKRRQSSTSTAASAPR